MDSNVVIARALLIVQVTLKLSIFILGIPIRYHLAWKKQHIQDLSSTMLETGMSHVKDATLQKEILLELYLPIIIMNHLAPKKDGMFPMKVIFQKIFGTIGQKRISQMSIKASLIK